MDASPICFETRADGGEVAKLGVWPVGLVRPWPYGNRTRVFWSVALPPASPRERQAYNFVSAKRGLLAEIADWLDGAGDQERAVRVRAQADQLEVAA